MKSQVAKSAEAATIEKKVRQFSKSQGLEDTLLAPTPGLGDACGQAYIIRGIVSLGLCPSIPGSKSRCAVKRDSLPRSVQVLGSFGVRLLRQDQASQHRTPTPEAHALQPQGPKARQVLNSQTYKFPKGF